MRRSATVKGDAAIPLITPTQIGLLSAANMVRTSSGTATWGTRFWSTIERSCTGASRYWKSLGATETITFSLWDDTGLLLVQKSTTTAASGVVALDWNSPITIAENRIYTLGAYTALAKANWSTNVVGPIGGEFCDGGVSFSFIWTSAGANVLPISQSVSSPAEKCPISPTLEVL